MSAERLEVPEIFRERRADSDTAIERLKTILMALGVEDGRHPLLTIYATGSLGRGELGTHSDLDVFLVDTAPASQRVGNLERIRLLSDLIRAADAANFGEFSNDGEFLRVHPLDDLSSFLGTRDDDASNVFTARMLLLLESVPLVGENAYSACVERVLSDYWRDERHAGFLPVFLVNDIVRYWKTMCLNYEARRADLTMPDDAQAIAKRRLALVKLRFNRLWMCFNGLAYLLAGYRPAAGDHPGSIDKDHAFSMVALRPLDRLLRTVDLVPAAVEPAQRALQELGWWLSISDREKRALREAFAEDDVYAEARDRGERFGNAMAELVEAVSQLTPLRRYLLL